MKTSARGPQKQVTPSFAASKGQLHRFRNKFGLKIMKITGEAASANEDAAATFLHRVEETD